MVSKTEILKIIQSLLIKYNDNILNNIYTKKNNVLEKDNKEYYIPKDNYNPATKLYVDKAASKINSSISLDLTLKADKTYVDSELTKKVDIKGHVLTDNNYTDIEKNKLAHIENNANNYIHPPNHEATIIEQDASHRFVTDIEKNVWNSKSDKNHTHPEYLTEVPLEYVTEEELDSKNYLTEHQDISTLASQTYVNNKVAQIVNSAPETLDTLNELASALGNDPNFATTIANQIGTKASNEYVNEELAKKVNIEGYVATDNNYTTIEKNKLASIENNANNYTHPINHEATVITEDSTHRFVTDTEKNIWNNKSDFSFEESTETNINIDESLSRHAHNNKSVLDSITEEKVISWNNKANQVDMELVEKRLDNLITNNNSTDGNAELIDIRVGADGITYSNAGTAVRTQLQQITEKNDTQDTRLKEVENKNKIQDIYINGLFNENVDGRLSIEGEGNDLKLEGSKDGLAEIESVKGNTLVNLVNGNEFVFSTKYPNIVINNLIKPNTQYTYILTGNVQNVSSIYCGSLDDSETLIPRTYNKFSGVVTSPSYNFTKEIKFICYTESTFTSDEVKTLRLLILEGDYTNKPIPYGYFEGLQSSFEDNLITQDMIDEGLEEAENLGKYKVPVRVVGKNKFVINNIISFGFTTSGVVNSLDGKHKFGILQLENGIDYTFSGTIGDNYTMNWSMYIFETDTLDLNINDTLYINYQFKHYSNDKKTYTFTPTKKYQLIHLGYASNISDLNLSDYQIEEGTVATDYEPYFERTANVYLNSPLLEGDEIVMYDGQLCHYHKKKQRVFNGSVNESWSNYSCETGSEVNTKGFTINYDDILPATYTNLLWTHLCDKLKPVAQSVIWSTDSEGISITTTPHIRLRVLCNKANNVDELKTYLQQNPITVVYELAEPYYEPIQADKLILECANSSTLHIDTIVPVESVKATYTGNIPSVYVLQETGEQNTYDIADTQIAVDYLLMSSRELGVMAMSLNTENTNLTEKGMNTMGAYFASRIMKGYLDYSTVVRKYPEFKEDIDFILRSEGREDLIVN